MSIWIYPVDGIAQGVRKHVIAEEALTCGNENIGVEESAPLGVVITALEVIQPGLWIMLVAIDHIPPSRRSPKRSTLGLFYGICILHCMINRSNIGELRLLPGLKDDNILLAAPSLFL